MATTPSCTVKFIGGPFDGHLQNLDLGLEELRKVVAIPVNCNVVSGLSDEPTLPKYPATSVAVYSLEHESTEMQYCYLGPGHPNQFQLEAWRG